MFDLSDHDFRLLHRACAGHTHERTHPDIIIQTCWDADRLDLGRVGIVPEPTRLCTAAAKQPGMLKWADGRASFDIIPDFVKDEWGIDLRPRHSTEVPFDWAKPALMSDRVPQPTKYPGSFMVWLGP